MSDDYEISRLKTPLRFENYKSYDSKGDLGKCVDLITHIEFFIEPKSDNLSDSEILMYAPKSKKASKIRLNNGFGGLRDILNLNPSVPWIISLYYIILICVFIPSFYYLNKLHMFIFLILCVIPLYYLGYKFNLNRYVQKYTNSIKKIEPTSNLKEETKEDLDNFLNSNDSKKLKEYKKQFKKLSKEYDDKEKLVKKVIKKRFEPPQLTYNKFIASVEDCHNLFYKEIDNAYDIIKLNKDTPKIKEELNNKIDVLNSIIEKIDNLSDELIVELGTNESSDELEYLLEDMDNLIKSIKKYN